MNDRDDQVASRLDFLKFDITSSSNRFYYIAKMLIAIVGTPSAGKRTVLQYLIEKHGFTQVGLESPADPMEGSKLVCPLL